MQVSCLVIKQASVQCCLQNNEEVSVESNNTNGGTDDRRQPALEQQRMDPTLVLLTVVGIWMIVRSGVTCQLLNVSHFMYITIDFKYFPVGNCFNSYPLLSMYLTPSFLIRMIINGACKAIQ